ncbi:hypothetical protein D3C71_1791230 [compost metagenome]
MLPQFGEKVISQDQVNIAHHDIIERSDGLDQARQRTIESWEVAHIVIFQIAVGKRILPFGHR